MKWIVWNVMKWIAALSLAASSSFNSIYFISLHQLHYIQLLSFIKLIDLTKIDWRSIKYCYNNCFMYFFKQFHSQAKCNWLKEIHSANKFICLMMDGFQSINVAKWVIACAMSQSIHHLNLFLLKQASNSTILSGSGSEEGRKNCVECIALHQQANNEI